MKGEKKIGEHTLAYDFNALCLAEDHVGPLGEAMQSMGAGSLKTVRALFWAGLQKHHTCTIEEAGEIAQTLGFGAVSEAVGGAIEAAFSGDGKRGKQKAVQD